MEPNALAWIAMLNLIGSVGTGVSDAADTCGVSRATLTLPARYAGPSESAAPALTVHTAIAVQEFLHARDPHQMADVSLTALVARLQMSADNVEVRAPARWLTRLHDVDTRREREYEVDPASGDVREERKESVKHLSQEELAFRIEALISTFRTLETIDDVRGVVDSLGGQAVVRRRYIDPLIRNAVAPPNKGLEAITALARIGWPAVERVVELLHNPWAFRLFRVLTYGVSNVRGGDESRRRVSSTTDLEKKQIKLSVEALLVADERVQRREADVYPGRALHIDLLKELSTLHHMRDLPEVRNQSGDLVEVLESRASNSRRPSRERCYALWLLHHLWAQPRPTERGPKVDWKSVIKWPDIASKLENDSDAGVRLALSTMSIWARDARWVEGEGGSANEVERTPELARIAAAVDRAFASTMDWIETGGPARTGVDVHAPLEPAIKLHLVQALATPNGRWRRQVGDALRGGLMQGRVASVLSALLVDDDVELWVKDRVCFLMGFLQDDAPTTVRSLHSFADEHLLSSEASGVEAAHAALMALADVLGLAMTKRPALELWGEAKDLFTRALEVSPKPFDTRVDLAGAYGLYLITAQGDPLPEPRSDEQAMILRREWVPVL